MKHSTSLLPSKEVFDYTYQMPFTNAEKPPHSEQYTPTPGQECSRSQENPRCYPFYVRGQEWKCIKVSAESTPPALTVERRKLRVRRAAQTHLLALMPSLRVAKPSATSDSAMFSPLVSEKEKKETWILGLNPSPIAKRLLMGPLSPSALQWIMLSTNWTRQQAGVGFFRKTSSPSKCLISRTQRSIHLLWTYFLVYLPSQRQSQELQETDGKARLK